MGIRETFSALRTIRSRHIVPALLVALEAGDNVLVTYAAKALIHSGDEGGMRAVVYRYNELPSAAQEAVCNSLHTLRNVITDLVRLGDTEIREIILHLLELNTSVDGAEALAKFLLDDREEYRSRAEAALKRVVARYQGARDNANEPVYDAAGEIVQPDNRRNRGRRQSAEQARLLFHALKVGIDSFPQHRREFILDSCLLVGGDCRALLTDALRRERGKSRLEPGPVEAFLVKRTDVRVLEYLLDKLCDHRTDLRAIAARALKAKSGSEVNSNFACLLDEGISDQTLRKVLAMSDGVPWLDLMRGHIDRYPARALRRLTREFNRLKLDGGKQAEFYSVIGETRDSQLSEECFARLAEIPVAQSGPALARLTQSKRLRSVLFGFQTMVDNGHRGTLQAAIKLIDSGWNAARDAATTYLAGRAYRRFVDNFDRLSEEDRLLAGAPLRHVDDQVIQELRNQIRDADPSIRLRALRLLDITCNAPRTGEALIELMHDPDSRVRATVVAMLSALGSRSAVAAIGGLLADPDPRVRANAIEAVEDLGQRSLARALVPYLRDDNNRIRANAAKALYSLGIDEAAEVMRTMLDSESELMRMSAVWVIRTARPPGGEAWLVARRKVEKQQSILERIQVALRLMKNPEGAGTWGVS